MKSASLIYFTHQYLFYEVKFSFVKVSSWLNEKNSVAVDESWRDPINLQAKLLKHQSFEAEILANRNRVQNLIKV